MVEQPVGESERVAARRLRAQALGELLPEVTADDRPEDGPAQDAAAERWYRENRPPHHG